MSRRTSKSSRTLAVLLVPLAFFASIASLSAHHSDPQNSAETAFLGLLATLVLCALVFVDRAPYWKVASTALLAALTLWALPTGEARGAAVALVLTAGLALAICPRSLPSACGNRARFSVALAISAQVLFRPEAWLAPAWGLAFASTAVLLPALAGLATAELSRQRGSSLLLSVAVVVALQRGVSPELTLVLVAFCAVSAALERRTSFLGWVSVALAILISSSSELGLLFATTRRGPEAVGELAWIPLLVPAILRPDRGRDLAVLAALGLALVGLWLLPASVALIVPLLVLFDCLPRRTVAVQLQATWSIALLIGSALAASYPWLRPRPTETALAMLNLEIGWQSASIVVLIFWSLSAILLRIPSKVPADRREARSNTYVAIAAIGCGLLIAILPSFRSLLAEPVVLSVSEPIQEIAADGSVSELFVDSYVSNGLSIAPGTPLAVISLEGRDGPLGQIELRAGMDTGEWAARRPGVIVMAPQPWISWLAPDARYLAQRYRAYRRFESPFEATSLRFHRLDNLPAELELASFPGGHETVSRSLVWILAGAGGSLVLSALDVLAGAGPIASTLDILPLVAGLLGAAHSIAVPKDPTQDRFFTARLACGSALVLLALAGAQLGLRYGEVLGSSAIFAGLACLLFWQAFASLRNLLQVTGHPRQVAFFLIVLAAYAGVLPWQNQQRPPDGDEPYYLLLAHSLAYDLDADLANNYEQDDSLEFMPRRIEPQPGDPVGPEGEQFSRHNALLPLVLAPFYRLAGMPGVLAVMALIAAALATVVFRLSELFFPELPGAGLLAASIGAMSPPLLLQSHQVWVEVPAALLVAIGFEAASRLRVGPNSHSELAKVLCAVLLLPLLKLRFLALALPILGIAAARAPRRLRNVLLLGAAVLSAMIVAILLFNHASFGQALKHHTTRSLLTYLTSPKDYLLAPFGLLFDSSLGLFFTAPIWMLLIPGSRELLRRRRGLFLDATIVCAPYLLLLGPRSEWYGGWSPVFRYGMVFLPFLALFLVPVLAQRGQRGVGFLIAALGGLSICLTLLWLVLPGWTYNFADGRGYLLDHLTMTLGADVARLFPSAVRPRLANLAWLLTLALLPGVALASSRKAGRATFGGGVAAVLLASAIVSSLAVALPTRVIEFEDPYVEKHGGQVWPDRWMPTRVAYRGAWQLAPGDSVAIAMRGAGREFDLALEMRSIGALGADATLELLADGQRVLRLPLPRSPGWSTLRIRAIPWPAGSEWLSFNLVASRGQVLLDRAHLDWRE